MTQGMVVAPQPEPVEVGAEVLRSGGNAVDAAVATALAQTVVDPFMCGIAGFGSMHLYLPSVGQHLCLDFHARAPGAVTAASTAAASLSSRTPSCVSSARMGAMKGSG